MPYISTNMVRSVKLRWMFFNHNIDRNVGTLVSVSGGLLTANYPMKLYETDVGPLTGLFQISYVRAGALKKRKRGPLTIGQGLAGCNQAVLIVMDLDVVIGGFSGAA